MGEELDNARADEAEAPRQANFLVQEGGTSGAESVEPGGVTGGGGSSGGAGSGNSGGSNPSGPVPPPEKRDFFLATPEAVAEVVRAIIAMGGTATRDEVQRHLGIKTSRHVDYPVSAAVRLGLLRRSGPREYTVTTAGMQLSSMASGGPDEAAVVRKRIEDNPFLARVMLGARVPTDELVVMARSTGLKETTIKPRVAKVNAWRRYFGK